MRRHSERSRGTWGLSALLLVTALVIVFGSAGSALGAKISANPTLQELARRVDTHYNRLHSLRVQFTESYQGMGMKRAESGTLLLAKPGRMKWSYTQPAGKLFLIDGKYGYSYTPGDAQAERYPAKQLEDFRSPLRFLLGHARIEKELTGLTMTPDGSNYRLRGVPKGMEQRVSEVELTVTADGTIQAIQWKETDGATTEFRLTGEQPNTPISADSFTFEPPAGVVVVHGLAPI
jgi:outer membrane lipoprotein carrier protein